MDPFLSLAVSFTTFSLSYTFVRPKERAAPDFWTYRLSQSKIVQDALHNFVVDAGHRCNLFLGQVPLVFDQPLDSVSLSSITKAPGPGQISKLGAPRSPSIPPTPWLRFCHKLLRVPSGLAGWGCA
jgi:hypothetical protein